MSTTETTPDAFDLDAWLADAHLPETTVRVNKYGHLAARLDDLEEQHAQARREESGDVRLSGKQGKAYPLAQEIEKVRAEMESGWLTIRLRGMTSDELERMNKAKAGEDKVVRAVAIQAVEPKLTEAQVKALRDAIGVGQFTQVVEAANHVAFGKVATPDFSPSALATLATGAPSTK